MPAEQTDGRNGECREENSPQSNSQFGIITNSETLGRLIYLKEHIDRDENLAPGAMQSRDFREPSRKGVSVSRLDHMNEKELFNLIDAFESRLNHLIFGIAVANTSKIRGLRTQQERRLFCVIDDATSVNPAHAVIQLENRQNVTKSSVRRPRNALLKLFKFYPRSEFLPSQGITPWKQLS